MDQYLDNRHKEILADLLANPANAGQAHVAVLQRMVNENPQSGVLQALLARADGAQDLKKAAAYLKPVALYKLLHNPESLQVVDPRRIVMDSAGELENYFSIPASTALSDEGVTEPEPDRVPFTEPELSDDRPYQQPATGQPDTVIVPAETEAALPPQHEAENETEAQPAPETEEKEQDLEEKESPQPETVEEPQPVTEIEDEVHDEIRDTSHVISELYDSYTEQLENPQTDEQPAEQPAEEPGTIVPELYNSYTEQLENPRTDEEPAEQPAEEPGTIIPELYSSYEDQLTEQKVEHPNTETPETEEKPEVNNQQQDSKPSAVADDIEDEVYDEIVGIDQIGFAQTVNVLHESELPETVTPENEGPWQNTFSDDEEYPEDEEQEDKRPLQQSTGITDADVHIDEEKLILGNIVSADYLMFDKKLDELRSGEKTLPDAEPVIEDTNEEAEPAKEPETVSRYNDETMPYSFMWWLDKTRKEHAGQFQPYVTNPAGQAASVQAETAEQQPRVKPVKRKAPDELQQQYYENIFSLTSVSGIEREDTNKGPEFDHNKKEDVIIERFITTEPQIRPPAADKLDNENKAKKSSEDQDALVTETLARIYTDQMLYHKAIATYKKLILKFPEKNLYFAAQIEQLEKKTN